MDDLKNIEEDFVEDVARVSCSRDVESLRVRYLGRKGRLQEVARVLASISASERVSLGKALNSAKRHIVETLDSLGENFSAKELEERLREEFIDSSLPGRKFVEGGYHILRKVLDDVLDIFRTMGFSVTLAPVVDDDSNIFKFLNFDDDHPAMDMQDTFYVGDGRALRPHTSNAQVRAMRSMEIPVRVVSPGKCFRNDDVSARSHVMFHQVEGLYVDRKVSMADLQSTLQYFLRQLFDDNVRMRTRPSYFPFVEPGMEVDISCIICNGKGCQLCKGSGWLEILGAGMVHVNVLKCGGIDPEQFSGYAWGMGVERLAMLKYGIDDIRNFTINNMDFLKQFRWI